MGIFDLAPDGMTVDLLLPEEPQTIDSEEEDI